MFGKLTQDEEQCIDKILTSGLDEINDVPSLAISFLSVHTLQNQQDNYELNFSQKEPINDKNLINKSQNNNMTNILQNDNNEDCNNGVNDELKTNIDNKNENINYSNLSLSLHLSSSINKKDNNISNDYYNIYCVFLSKIINSN